MPKYTAANSTIARNEQTSLYERIYITPATRRQFKDVGKPRKPYNPGERPLVQRILSKEEYAEINKEFEEHVADRDLLSRLLVEKRKLEDRLTTPPPPLIERVAPPAYQAPAPIPKKLKFRKQKIFKRIEEYRALVNPTITRLNPVMAKLNERMAGPGTSVEKTAEDNRLEPVWKMYNRLQEIRDIMTEEGHNFGASDWRKLKGACKRIGKVSFENLDERIDEICNTLIAMDLTIP